jgi:hypothetical protein
MEYFQAGQDQMAFSTNLLRDQQIGITSTSAVPAESCSVNATFVQDRLVSSTFAGNRTMDTAIVTPNSDTPYSTMFMDLRAEPLVLSVPAVDPKRYYSVMLCDGNTYNYGYVGSRATGSDPGDYMVTGPEWRGAAPAGIKKVFRSSTQFSAAAYRTQLFNSDDMDNVIKIQDGYKIRTLSSYLNQPPPAPAPAIEFPKIDKELLTTRPNRYHYPVRPHSVHRAPGRTSEPWLVVVAGLSYVM